MRHHQMAMDKVSKCFSVRFIQKQCFCHLQGKTRSDLTMIFGIPLTQVMNQQRQVKQVLLFGLPVRLTENGVGGRKFGCKLYRSDRVLVDRVFVILVELQQAASPFKAGNEFSEHAELMQPSEL